MAVQAPLRLEEIGGGRVLRPFDSEQLRVALGLKVRETPLGPRAEIPRNTVLNHDHLASIARHNLLTLIENRYLEVWPLIAGAGVPRETRGRKSGDAAERHVLSQGFGKYLVVEGTILGRDLKRDEAEALAAARPPATGPTEAKPRRAKRAKAAAH